MKITAEIEEFMRANAGADIASLRLKYAGASGMDYGFAITQLECRRKAAGKLRQTLARVPGFVFPSTLLAEQSSADALAAFHASLTHGAGRVLDLTAGLLIDDLHIAAEGAQVTALEIDPDNAAAATANAASAQADIKVINVAAEEYLASTTETFDLIFADPARRHSPHGSRIYSLRDSSPDIVALLPKLREVAPRLLVKCSPMADITRLCAEVEGTEHVYIVAIGHECKEILLSVDLRNDKHSGVKVTSVMLDADGCAVRRFEYPLGAVATSSLLIGAPEPGMYLYEPAPEVMKGGAAAMSAIAAAYPDLRKLHPNTHVFVSQELHRDFPGRILAIRQSTSVREARRHFAGERRNVVCRNFGMRPEELSKRLRTADGGEDFLYGVKTAGGSLVIDCRPI